MENKQPKTSIGKAVAKLIMPELKSHNVKEILKQARENIITREPFIRKELPPLIVVFNKSVKEGETTLLINGYQFTLYDLRLDKEYTNGDKEYISHIYTYAEQ